MPFVISIIIPVFNEETNLPSLLDSIIKFPQSEFIFVDGGSTDRSVEILSKLSGFDHVKIITSKKSRSIQMNTGAEIATGKILLFLHADTKISVNSLYRIISFAEAGKNVVGCYKFRVDSENFRFRILEFLVELRNYILDLPFGDQAFFVSRSIWNRMGGFKEIPIMEDLEWIKRVNQNFDLTIIPFFAVTDGRRWKKNGFLKNSALNIYLQFRFFRGDNPTHLHSLYYPQN